MTLGRCFAALLSAVVFGWGGGAAAQTLFKMGHTLTAGSHFGVGGAAFAEAVARDTGGRFRVQLYPDGTLGAERELLEGVQEGSVDLAIVSTGAVGIFVPETQITDIPFLFRNYAHARSVLDGPIGQEMLALFPKHDLIALAWGENGFRHLTNSVRPVRVPDDLKGMKMRTMQNSLHVLTFATLGARPIPIPFTELYSALEQHAVDGQENPTPTVVKSRFFEVQKYLSLTGHFYSPALVLMAPARWNALSDSDREIFRHAAKLAAIAMRNEVDRMERDSLALLRSAGMEVTLVDQALFERAVTPVYADCARRFGQDRIDRIIKYRE